MATVGPGNVIDHGSHPWWQDYSAADLRYKFMTGAIPERDVRGMKVWTFGLNRSGFGATPMGTVMRNHMNANEPGFNYDGTDGMVWQDQPNDYPLDDQGGGTTIYIPIGNGQYSGVKFGPDPIKMQINKDKQANDARQAAIDAARERAQIEKQNPGSTGIPGGLAGLPPGPGSYVPGSGGPTAETQAIEFSVTDDGNGFWVARTPAASAANKDGNPHKGISIINPGEWGRVSGGSSVHEALSLDEFKSKGWKGLDRPFLAWQGTDSQPAGEELASAMEAAMEGDAGAMRALRAVGVTWSGTAEESQKGLFGSLGFKF